MANKAAQLLGRLRWERMTPEQQAEHVRIMVAGQRRKRRHLAAKAKGKKGKR